MKAFVIVGDQGTAATGPATSPRATRGKSGQARSPGSALRDSGNGVSVDSLVRQATPLPGELQFLYAHGGAMPTFSARLGAYWPGRPAAVQDGTGRARQRDRRCHHSPHRHR